MDIQTQNETKQELLNPQAFYTSIAGGLDMVMLHPDLTHAVVKPEIIKLSRDERLRLAVNELHIGQRIHDELKRNGITVTWLAQQLNMERSGLYYTFRHNSISLELLLRISAILNHNFMQDVTDIYRKYGL